MIADVVTAQVVGFGKDGYPMAVRAAANMTIKA
jgi:3-dehydroquinate dehydratase